MLKRQSFSPPFDQLEKSALVFFGVVDVRINAFEAKLDALATLPVNSL